jgi:protease-4
MLAGEEESNSQPADALATLAPAPEWRLRAALADLKSVLSGPSIQVRCLDCGPVAPVARQTTDAGLVRSLLGWLTA